jgi:hypothetical protein
VYGGTQDKSEYAQFAMYEDMYYVDKLRAFPEEQLPIGKCLGAAHDVGDKMTFWVLTATVKVHARLSKDLPPTSTAYRAPSSRRKDGSS